MKMMAHKTMIPLFCAGEATKTGSNPCALYQNIIATNKPVMTRMVPVSRT